MKKTLLLVSLVMILLFGCIGDGDSNQVSTEDSVNSAATGDVVNSVSTGDVVNSVSNADSVVIPLSDVTETVKHYEFDAGGAKVKYFAVKGSDGVVRTAFDACEVCFKSRKGYTQVGSDVMCNNCGLRFKIDELGTKNKGRGCWPAYLPHEVRGSEVVIKKADLQAGAYLFS